MQRWLSAKKHILTLLQKEYNGHTWQTTNPSGLAEKGTACITYLLNMKQTCCMSEAENSAWLSNVCDFYQQPEEVGNHLTHTCTSVLPHKQFESYFHNREVSWLISVIFCRNVLVKRKKYLLSYYLNNKRALKCVFFCQELTFRSGRHVSSCIWMAESQHWHLWTVKSYLLHLEEKEQNDS